MAIEQLCFDYGFLDEPTRAFVREKVQAIHTRLRRTAEDIIAVGQDLIAVNEKLAPHGKFHAWLRAEFDMTRQSAYRFMGVAKKFGSCNIMLQHSPTVLYSLLDISDDVVQMVETGQIPAAIPAIRNAQREILSEGVISQRVFPDVFYHEPAIPTAETEESRYQTAVDMGTTDLYYDNLRREAIEKDKEERRDAHVMRIMGSSESPEWYTPREIVDRVRGYFGEIDIDPCSNSHEEPNVPARTLYTREDDGLDHPWHGKVYMNPPYGAEIPAWIQKLIREYEELGHIEEAIILIPARIDTQWFQPLYAYPMCHIRGRLQFENAQYSAPFPSIVVYLGPHSDKFIDAFKELGPIMGRIG